MKLLSFPDSPPSARLAEADLINAIKEEVYKYSNTMTVVQALGCLDVAKIEIHEEAK